MGHTTPWPKAQVHQEAHTARPSSEPSMLVAVVAHDQHQISAGECPFQAIGIETVAWKPRGRIPLVALSLAIFFSIKI